jgi:uncharacterized protein YneF (UPF0154 family)
MLSLFLQVMTLTVALIVMIIVGASVKKQYMEPNVSATDVMEPLITGDRFREVLRESATRLMTGCEGGFLPSPAYTSLQLYPVNA